MRILYKTLSITFIIVFIVAIGKVGYDLYNFEDKLAKSLNIVEISQKKSIEPNVFGLSLFIGAALGSGLLAIMFLILNSQAALKNRKPNIIYVDKDNKEQGRDYEYQANDSGLNMDDIGKIRTLINETKGNIKTTLERTLSAICSYVQASQGALYIATVKHGLHFIELEAGYAYFTPESQKVMYEFGEGLAGQVAKDGKTVMINNIPDGYMTVISGLGNASPNYLMIVPIRNSQEEIVGVIEMASFEKFKDSHKIYTEKVASLLAEQIVAYPLNIED